MRSPPSGQQRASPVRAARVDGRPGGLSSVAALTLVRLGAQYVSPGRAPPRLIKLRPACAGEPKAARHGNVADEAGWLRSQGRPAES
eukprot:3008602-Pyramimonas_sp.AAC.1